MGKLKPHQRPSIINQALVERRSVRDPHRTNCFVVSFKDLDLNQADSIAEWAQRGLLERMIETFKGYCADELRKQEDKEKFLIYGGFPAKSEYYHPAHVPEDAEWGRIHLGNKEVIAGHIVGNIFYVVFLDGAHKFWVSEKRNT